MSSMGPVFRWTLWERRWSIFWWCVGLGIYVALVVLVYASFQGQTKQLDQVLSHMSPSVKALFSDSADFLTGGGYLSSQIYYLIAPMLLAVLSIGLGSSLIAREEQNGTLELLLSRPVRRSTLVLSKFAAMVGVLLLAGVVIAVTTIVCDPVVHLNIPAVNVLVAALATTVLSLLFGAVAFALSAFGGVSRALSIGLSVFLLLGGYLATSLEGMVGALRWPAKLLPYHYFLPSDNFDGIFHWSYIGGMAIAIVVLLFLSLIGFRRRDIG